MKIARIVMLSITALLCNNLQPMELPKKYPLEEQLLNGDISYGEYLLMLEETSQQYGQMLEDLRTAEYVDPRDDIYTEFIENMDEQLQSMREMLNQWDQKKRDVTKKEAFNMFLENLYNLRQAIPGKYDILVEMVVDGRAEITGRILGG